MKTKSISILGCGWMGLPLAKACVEGHFIVKGSTTSKDKLKILQSNAIAPFLITCQPDIKGENIQEFFNAQILFLNLPFKRDFKDPAIYKKQIDSVLDCVKQSSVEWIIFASSTSIYPDQSGEVTEDSPVAFADDRAKVLSDVEEAILKNSGKSATILRFSGLIGPGREPGRFLSGQTKLKGGKAPVNLVHLDDCVAIILQVIEKGVKNMILNVCADEHPFKKDFYFHAAKMVGLPKPQFLEEEVSSGKVINNHKMKTVLGYTFKYPDPLMALGAHA